VANDANKQEVDMTRGQRQGGSALIIVLGIIAVVTITAGAMCYTANQQMHTARVTRETLKARLIAESGLNKAYNEVRGDFSKIDSCAQSGTLGDGTYAVRTVTALGGHPNRAQIISEGRCGIGRATVSADLENIPIITSEGSGDANFIQLPYDLQVGGTLDFAGNAEALFELIYALRDLTERGNPTFADVVSFFSSAGIDIKAGNIDGSYEIFENQPPQAIVTAVLIAAINALKEYAIKNGAVYDSGDEIPDSPPGGVAYCRGDAKKWSGQGTGCFIIDGEVSFQGSGIDIKSVNNYPALIVLSASEVKFNADAEIHGAIILPNASFTVNGHADIYGVIVVGQSARINGTANLHQGVGGRGFEVPSAESVKDNVVITAWH